MNIVDWSIPKFSVVKNHHRFMIYDRTDLGTLLEVYLHQEYKLPEIDRPVKTILDLGANRGYASTYFASIYSTARIVAVEADRDNVVKIKFNTDSFGQRISVEFGAIAQKSGVIDFYRNLKSNISGSTIDRDNRGDKISVRAFTLADLEKIYGGFDIVKFDIEGGEWDAIDPNALKQAPAVFVGEYHEDLIGRPVSDFVRRFHNYDIVVRQIMCRRFVLTMTLKVI